MRVGISVAVVTLLACSEQRASPPAQGPTNAILISLDTLRADHLGVYGYRQPTSPNLDRIAAEGIVFERAIAQSPWTAPSHRSLFQSRYVSATRKDGRMLAEELRRRGFQTAAFVGGGHLSASRGLGFEWGFDTYLEEPGGFRVSFPSIAQWLRTKARSPFFLFIHTYDIHGPYDPPPPYSELFFPDYTGTLKAADTVKLINRVRRRKEYEDTAGEVHLTPQDRKRLEALYDGDIAFADHYIGLLYGLLEELGLLERCIVVILSDHGEEFWDHGSLGHGHTLYQELLHAPLILRQPGGRDAGSRVTETVQLIDVAPTLLDLLGLAPSAEFHGQSLLRLPSEGENARRVAVGEYRHLRAVVRHPWKLVIDEHKSTRELYDLETDPGETRSLAELHPELVRSLQELLDQARGGVEEAGDAESDVPSQVPGELEEQLRALGYIE